jgi:hypothetical protein
MNIKDQAEACLAEILVQSRHVWDTSLSHQPLIKLVDPVHALKSAILVMLGYHMGIQTSGHPNRDEYARILFEGVSRVLGADCTGNAYSG